MIIIYTDGSSRGNPGKGGYGAIVIGEKTVVELGGREELTTNNRMELRGAIEALRFLAQVKLVDTAVCIRTDSQYVIKGMTQWIIGWQKKNWIGSNKKGVLNRDLWEDLLTASSPYTVTWEYVRGHVGNVGNERADTLATTFADDLEIELYAGPRGPYVERYSGIV